VELGLEDVANFICPRIMGLPSALRLWPVRLHTGRDF
jgi:hypothetical protein